MTVRGRSGRAGRALVVLALCCGGEASARVQVDIGQLTMGRVTLPERGFSVDLMHEYRMREWHDPTRDTLRGTYEAGYGLRDGLSLDLISMTRSANRTAYVLARVGAGVTLRVLDQPLQIAPFVRALPSVRGRDFQLETGLKAARNYGNFTAFMYHKADFDKNRSSGAYGFDEYEVEPGLLYRFGLRGVAGVEWEYHTTGEHVLGILFGGSLSRQLFLGIEEKFGLNGRTADATTRIQLSFYFGRTALGSWGL